MKQLTHLLLVATLLFGGTGLVLLPTEALAKKTTKDTGSSKNPKKNRVEGKRAHYTTEATPRKAASGEKKRKRKRSRKSSKTVKNADGTTVAASWPAERRQQERKEKKAARTKVNKRSTNGMSVDFRADRASSVIPRMQRTRSGELVQPTNS